MSTLLDQFILLFAQFYMHYASHLIKRKYISFDEEKTTLTQVVIKHMADTFKQNQSTEIIGSSSEKNILTEKLKYLSL